MSEPAKPNGENSITLKPTPGSSSDSENISKVLSWIIDQITLLAEGFGEGLTDERMEIYARALADIPQDRLNVSFQRALRELTFFPKVSELRNLAGSSAEDEEKVKANAAWDHVNEYLHKWGVDRLTDFSGGKTVTAPPLDARIDYALRRIGGLQALNQMDVDRRPFMYREFCEAYRLAPVAESMAGALQQQFGENKLMGNIKQLNNTTALKGDGEKPTTKKGLPKVERSDAWYAERRARLKREADELLAKRKS